MYEIFRDLVPGIVIDPYAGSGTTGLAMRDLGLRGLLIEREPAYCQGILPPLPRFAAEVPRTEIAAIAPAAQLTNPLEHIESLNAG